MFAEIVARYRAAGGVIDSCLEIGSFEVNGSVRQLLNARKHIGVDLIDGPGVDVVGFGHQVQLGFESFDCVIALETFEHDPHFEHTFANMIRHAKPNGIVIFTCASKGRLEHGTERTTATDSPGTQKLGLDYYKNLTAKDFRKLECMNKFSKHLFFFNPISCDLYFYGIVDSGKAEEALSPQVKRQTLLDISFGSGSKLKNLLLFALSIFGALISDKQIQTLKRKLILVSRR